MSFTFPSIEQANLSYLDTSNLLAWSFGVAPTLRMLDENSLCSWIGIFHQVRLELMERDLERPRKAKKVQPMFWLVKPDVEAEPKD